MLSKIFDIKKEEVAIAKESLPLSDLEKEAAKQPATRGFLKALQGANKPALIAEVKKASPSQGLIRRNFDPAEIARAYERAGATALSVLTDVPHFQGAPENILLAKAACALPTLRKDFIEDPYQIYEARAWGADALLLIVASLEEEQLRELYKLTKSLEMDVLVEVHSMEELNIAVRNGFDLIGVNNRDLSTFKTSLSISDELLPLVKGHALGVSESAIETHEDVSRVAAAGADAVLIGTTFCAQPEIEPTVREVMGWQ